MQQEEVQKLVEKYLHNIASKEETDKLFRWYQSESSRDAEWVVDNFEDEQLLKSRLYAKIMKHNGFETEMPARRFWSKLTIAATISVFLASALYLYSTKEQVQKNVIVEARVKSKLNDIQPGGHKAILILADGRKIVLEDSKNGILVNQGGVKVQKNSNGIIEYTLTKQNNNSINEPEKVQNIYNTIQTPVGGKYQLNLADGSKVWLNSASSLRFPVFFTGDTRGVELKGEAYFEVSNDIHKKFSVRSGNQSVEVLGTHFNINAYSDEPSITTTLLEGEVRVIELNNNNSQILKPGEQSKVDRSIKIKRIDTQVEVAWKEGYFYFKNADIETVMRQLGRWYGVTARYEGVFPEQHFAGAISTNLTLLEVLEILEKSNIHFRLEGKEVIVMP